jgi:hypothetical protein
MADDVWPVVHAERRALADDLAQLSPEQWAAPSLCAGRSVQETLAHMAATAEMTPPAFFAKMLAAGFRFESMADKEIRARTAGGPTATLERFRADVDRSSGPPGPATSWLGETDFYAGSNLLIGGKRRVAGVTLRATDAGWSRGEGPAVEGRALALLMVTAGRGAFLGELSGPGLDSLSGRFSAQGRGSAG